MKKSVIYGLNTVSTAIKKQATYIEELMLLKGQHSKRTQEVLELAEKYKIHHVFCSKRELDALVGADVNHQGVAARILSKQFHENDVDQILDNVEESAFILVLDGVQDPRNLGACMRSANAAGVHMVIAPKDNAVALTTIARKVASGAAECTPYIQVTNLSRTLKKLKKRGIWLYGLSERGEKTLYETDFRGDRALVLGAEGSGLRRLTEENCDLLVSIPMMGEVESLNVSVAAGVTLYECYRQNI